LLDTCVVSAVFFSALVTLEVLSSAVCGVEAGPRLTSGWVLVIQRAVLAAITACVLAALLRKNRQPATTIGVRTDRTVRAALWGLAAYLTVLGYVLLVSYLVGLIWPGAEQASRALEQKNIQRLPPMGLSQAIPFAVLVSIGEELFFRGFLVTRLRALTRSWTAAVLIISTLFAVLHIPQGGLAVGLIFGIGALLGVWMIWRANLIVPIVAHALFDITSLVMLKYR
jgi:membrane protease YdiL (CAAX protease family)